jgi:hypothetical protein
MNIQKWYFVCFVRFQNSDRKTKSLKYDKQDQQGKAAFNKRNRHMTQQQEPVARSPGRPQTKQTPKSH